VWLGIKEELLAGRAYDWSPDDKQIVVCDFTSKTADSQDNYTSDPTLSGYIHVTRWSVFSSRIWCDAFARFITARNDPDHTVPPSESLSFPSPQFAASIKFRPLFAHLHRPVRCVLSLLSISWAQFGHEQKLRLPRLAAVNYVAFGLNWSGREDSNLRPHGPERRRVWHLSN